MGGFMGLGGSSADTDRGSELSARQGLWDLSNWQGFEGRAGVKKGQDTLGRGLETLTSPKAYWQGLMAPGRTQATQQAAPMANAVQDQTDATRRGEAEMGTGRGGGTASFNRESGATATKSIDDLISASMMGGRRDAAEGLTDVATREAGIGGAEAGLGVDLLRGGQAAVEDIMTDSRLSRPTSYQINRDTGASYGSMIGGLIRLGLAF